MIPILGILAVGIGIALYEVPTLLNKKLKRELWVFSILLIVGIILSIMESLNMDIPNPADWSNIIFKPFSDWIFSILE